MVKTSHQKCTNNKYEVKNRVKIQNILSALPRLRRSLPVSVTPLPGLRPSWFSPLGRRPFLMTRHYIRTLPSDGLLSLPCSPVKSSCIALSVCVPDYWTVSTLLAACTALPCLFAWGFLCYSCVVRPPHPTPMPPVSKSLHLYRSLKTFNLLHPHPAFESRDVPAWYSVLSYLSCNPLFFWEIQVGLC